jgi:hypothetical protein
VGYGAAIVALLVLGVCVRLAFEPISLDFLRFQVAQEFDTSAGRMKIGADHLYAAWGGLGQPMRLVLQGLRVTNERNQTVATAPSVAVSFEPDNVLKARFLPTSIVVDRPTLDVEITRQGGMLQRVLARSDASSQSEVVRLLIEQLLARPNYTTLLGQLDMVIVQHAHVTVRDVPSGVVWAAPDVQGRLKRDDSGVILSARGRFDEGGGPVDVSLSGKYARDRSRISVEAKIDGLKPRMLAGLSPDAEPLRGIDVALSGRLRIEAGGAGDIRSVAVEVTGGPGTLTLPGILPASQEIRSVSAVASVDAASHTAKIDHVVVDLGGAELSLTGTGTRTAEGQTFNGHAEIRRIPVDRLADYWPLEFAEGGRQWAIANLNHGTLDVAADFALSTPGDDLSRAKVDRLGASLGYRGMNVRYMPNMPELADVTGKADYRDGTLHFEVAHGTGAGLSVKDATIDLTGLDAPAPQHATLHVPIVGPASSAIAFLGRRALHLPKNVLYDPRRVGGNVTVDLSLAFPLLNAITVADIDVKAAASLDHYMLRDALGKVDLSDGTIRVRYDGALLDVAGTARLDGHPVDLSWREQFGAKPSYRERYELKGTVPAELIDKAGFPSPQPFVTGPVNVTRLIYQVAPNGTGDLQGRFDLENASVSVPPVGWTKAKGVAASFDLKLKLGVGGKLASAEFDARGDGLNAKGTVGFGPGDAVQHVSLGELASGRTNVGLDWRRGPSGVDLDVHGRALELSKVRQALHERDESAKVTPGGAAQKARERTRVTVHLDQVLVQRGSLGALNGRFEMSGDRIASADLALAAGRGTAFRVQPVGAVRNVSLHVGDFGQLLHDAGWLDGLAGGYLDFRGRFDASVDAPLVGTLKLGPYRLQKVDPRPGVDSLNATIASLSRVGNGLQQFDGLDAEIVKSGDLVDVRNGRTSGRSIGLTTAGYLDLATDTARLRGLVVPGFVVNNLLSNVPLLGPLLTGGKGAGLFAISYRLEGPFDDLKSDVNMMSAITPGALRELFNSRETPPPTDKSPTP